MVGTKRNRHGLETSIEKEAKKPKQPKISGAETVEKKDDDNVELKVFLNPLIMDKIIKNLPLRCLPTLRSTCQLWNKLMAVEFRNRKANTNPYLVNVSKDSVDHVFDTLNEATEVPFSAYKFAELQMKNSKVQKVVEKAGGVMTHLQLDLSKLSLPMETFRNLLFKQCAVLRSLGLSDNTKSGIPRFWKSKLQTEGNKEEIQRLPHLKNISLGIWFKKTKSQVYPTSSFGLIKDLFNAAINLETVKIYDNGSSGHILNGVILDILTQRNVVGNLHKIQKIEFGEGVSIKNLEYLVELSSREPAANQLCLKELDLQYFLSDDCFIDPQGVVLMHQFLNLQAPSLEKLTASLGEDSIEKGYKVTLPIMASLKTLELQIDYSYYSPPGNANVHVNPNNDDVNAPANNIGQILPNIRFESLITNFPNLQKLELMDWLFNSVDDSEDEEEDDDDDDLEQEAAVYEAKRIAFMAQLESHLGVTEFSVSLDAKDSSYLVDYASLFPNIKNLTVTLPSELYPEVWSVWPALEQLTIHLWLDSEETEIDSCITGIPSHSLKLLKSSTSSNKTKVKAIDAEGKRNVNEGKKEEENKELELDWKKYKTQAGIFDLHELHTFNLDYIQGFISPKSYMTDLSANYGFIPTANNYKLRKIYIESCSNFSPEVVAAVETSLGLHGDFVPIDEGVKRREEERSQQGHHSCHHH